MPKTKPDRKMSQRADRHALYERSVQDVETEVRLLKEFYYRARKRQARSLREDFSGTAGLACSWVKSNPYHHAVAVDNDPEVLDWGRRHHFERLKPGQQKRIRLVQADVRKAPRGPFDLIVALNFSYWLFRDRRTLREYFSTVRGALGRDGLFIIDAYGGADARRTLRERRTFGSFTYIWHQAAFDPVTGNILCHIHFKFRDGSRLNQAFSYEWRLWTLPELRELLLEAGFARTRVLWQGTDEKSGEGNGEYHVVERGDADPAWIAYIEADPR